MAESVSQRSCSPSASGAGLACGAEPFVASVVADMSATLAQRSANPAYRNDQPQPSCFKSNAGSKKSGKPSSASNDAKLESANRRYGTALSKRRQYPACSSGVVVERRKY